MATYIFGNIENKTTLGRSPFLSRFTEFESTSENYAFIGFTPGLALQAAELNELQDNFHKISTLNSILLSNWTVYCIKQGAEGLENSDGFLWDGVVPIKPDMVTINGDIVTCADGWYCVTDPSGIKYWVFNPTSISVSTTLFTSGFVNFTITTNDIFASTDESGDDRLFDNSSGFPNTNSPGAYRIQRNFSSLQISVITNGFSVVRKTNNVFSWPNGIQIAN